MRKLLVGFLNLYGSIHKGIRKLRGKTEQDEIDERVVSHKAWDEFCDSLKAAGNNLYLGAAPQDPFNQAEGLRYLSRLTRAGLESMLEYSDPGYPVLRKMVGPTIKMGADNPDNHYFNAKITGEYEYRLTGKRNTIHYIGFFTQNGNYGTTGGLERKGKNWLKIEEETSLCMVRQTFMDRENEVPAEVHLEVINGKSHPDNLTPQAVNDGLNGAGLFVAGATLLFARWSNGFTKHTNKLPLFDPETSNAAGGDNNITYYHSHWKLAEDEALVVETEVPNCDHWNFQLNNYWMESLDYRYFQICVNKGNGVLLPDGRLRVVVSAKDPKLPNTNWLDTCAHDQGTMCWRWYRADKPHHELPEPQCRVMKMDEVAKLEA
jgi:hypothetical protein